MTTKPKVKGRMLRMACCCPSGRPIRVSRGQAELGGYWCDLCGCQWLLDGAPRMGGAEERAACIDEIMVSRPGLSVAQVNKAAGAAQDEIESRSKVDRAVQLLSRLTVEELDLAIERTQATPLY